MYNFLLCRIVTFVQYVKRLLQKTNKDHQWKKGKRKIKSLTVMTSIDETKFPNSTVIDDRHRSSEKVVESCRLEAETHQRDLFLQ